MAGYVRRTLGMALISGLAAAGCGGDGPTLVGLTGKVTLAGQPIEGAAVMFMPALSGKDAQPAQDTTASDGSFKLRTGDRSGVVPGQYTVTIIKAPPASSSKDAADDPFMATMAPADPRAARGKKKAESPPGQFTFDREVVKQGGTLDFDLPEKATK